MDYKICCNCNASKKLSEFSKTIKSKDNLCPSCKECNKIKYQQNKKRILEQKKEYYSNNTESIQKKNKIRKKINKDRYSKNRRIEYQKNHEQKKAEVLKWQKNNPEKVKQMGIKYRGSHREEAKNTTKIWRENNPEKITLQRKNVVKKRREKRKKYLEDNKERLAFEKSERKKKKMVKKLAYNAKRRAAKLQRTPSWLTPQNYKRIESFYLEAQWKTQTTGIKHHVDHIYPLQGDWVCGLHHPDNLQVLTATENISKGTRRTNSHSLTIKCG